MHKIQKKEGGDGIFTKCNGAHGVRQPHPADRRAHISDERLLTIIQSDI